MKPPERLYKYRGVDKFLSDLFVRKKMFFNTPGRLNDPFELLPILDSGCTEESWTAAAEGEIRDNHPGYSEAQVRQALLRRKRENYPPSEKDLNEITQKYRDRLSRVGIFSTSERWDSIVMWSHYADEHRGVCIGLDPQALDDFVGFWPVTYSADRPVINLFSDRVRANSIAAGTKNDEWAYEKEWRIVLETRKVGRAFPMEVDIPDGLISEVILGERMSVGDRERVVDWVKLMDPLPQLYVARIHDKHYRVTRDPFS